MTFTRGSLGLSAFVAIAGLSVTPACTSDDDAAAPATKCTSTGGPVAGAEDMHCVDDGGKQVVQTIGKCNPDGSGAAGADGGGGATGTDGAGGHDEHDHERADGGTDSGTGPDDEEYAVRYGSESADDDCKYDTSFSTTCLEVGKNVTISLTLRQRATGNPGNGGHPDSPEIFLADKPSHISPSNSIKATEGPLGTYQIGPVVFDQPGRWVIRFHYFESCSDIPPDSPHGHVAFYVDVP
jgi:hypothetical protein